MKKVLIGVGALVVVLIVAAVVIPFFVPTETIRNKVASAVEDSTGRKLTIGGAFGVSIFPSVQVVAGDVAFANMAGARDASMATLKELRIGLQVMPLLAGEVKLDRFVLVEPVIHLEVGRDGKANWDFGGKPAAEKDGKTKTADGGVGLKQLSLGQVELVRGLVTYADARSNQKVEIRDINMRVSLPDLDSPFAADGSLAWNGRKVTLKAGSDKPRALLEGAKAPVTANVSSDVLTLGFTGSVATAGTLNVGGDVTIDVPSVRDLAAWAGQPIQLKGSGLGPFKLAGKANVVGSRYGFAATQISLDQITGQGTIAVDTGKAKPTIEGDLKLGMLDLNLYLPPSEEAKAAPAAAQKQAPTDWSDEPIDMSGLHAANARLALAVAGIQIRKIKIGEGAVAVSLQDGLMQLDLTKLGLYGGGGTSRLVVDARGKVPSIAKTLNIDGVSAAPLLADAAGFERLEGTGSIQYAVSTKGRSERELVSALNGDGAIVFRDGAIKGINLAAMVRNAAAAFTTSGETQKTDFAELSGSFKITNGIVDNRDTKLLSPLLRVLAAGKVDLPKRTLDYRVEPKAVASLEGQGGQGDLGGLMVPVVISGPWASPSFKPDLSGAVKQMVADPSKAKEAIKGQLDQLKNLGGTNSSPAAGAATQDPAAAKPSGGLPVPDAGKALKGLFGK